MRRIGSDTGGTFTDLVSPSGRVVKVLSTPDNPAEAVAAGVRQMLAESAEAGESAADDSASQRTLDELTHGTTVATNALLERRGARVALITNAGFADIIEIARQDRPALYDSFADRPPPLVRRADRLEVPGRLDARGRELEPLAPDQLPDIPAGVEAVAICLLHSDLNPAHEAALRDHLAARFAAAEETDGRTDAETETDRQTDAQIYRQTDGQTDNRSETDTQTDAQIYRQIDARTPPPIPDISCSHEIAPEFREYERASTTVINSYLRPRCRSYLTSLSQLTLDPESESESESKSESKSESEIETETETKTASNSETKTTPTPTVLVMTSAGGLLPAREAAESPARLLLSGPAGGVRAAAAAARANDHPDAVTLDMGGTSADICLILDGQPAPAAQRDIAGYPLRAPSLNVLTIGAGGGSIAHIDPGGALKVGPRSAGAHPGPACYNRGGTQPTVTDANLLCGRLPAEARLATLTLNTPAARAAFDRTGIDPRGVLQVVNANMEQALRAATTRQGIDPRHLALIAFGGAGPLHACDLADLLGITTIIIPARAGALSAVGILGAPRQVDLVASLRHPAPPPPLDQTAETDETDRRTDRQTDATNQTDQTAPIYKTARQTDDTHQQAHAEALARQLTVAALARLPAADELTIRYDCRYHGQSHEIQVASPDLFHHAHRRQNGYARPDTPVEVVAVRATARQNVAIPLPDLPRQQATGPAVIAEPDTTIWVAAGWSTELGAAGSLLLRRR